MWPPTGQRAGRPYRARDTGNPDPPGRRGGHGGAEPRPRAGGKLDAPGLQQAREGDTHPDPEAIPGRVTDGGRILDERRQRPAETRLECRIELGHRVAAWRSEEHTSELQSLMRTTYAVFCLKKQSN